MAAPAEIHLVSTQRGYFHYFLIIPILSLSGSVQIWLFVDIHLSVRVEVPPDFKLRMAKSGFSGLTSHPSSHSLVNFSFLTL